MLQLLVAFIYICAAFGARTYELLVSEPHYGAQLTSMNWQWALTDPLNPGDSTSSWLNGPAQLPEPS